MMKSSFNRCLNRTQEEIKEERNDTVFSDIKNVYSTTSPMYIIVQTACRATQHIPDFQKRSGPSLVRPTNNLVLSIIPLTPLHHPTPYNTQYNPR